MRNTQISAGGSETQTSGPSALLSRFRLVRNFSQNFYLITVCWAAVLLAPHMPGLPRPSVGGLSWRQELSFSLLLAFTLGILSKQNKFNSIRSERRTLFMVLTLAAFVLWILLSCLWAVTPYAAIHLGAQWFLYLVFFAIITHVAKDSKKIHSSLVVLGGIVSILAIACAIESWFGAPLTDGNLRADLKPILRGSAGFGEIMAMASILFSGFCLYAKQTKQALSAGCIAILSWLATLQSLERAPFLGAVAGYGLLIVGIVLSRSLTKHSALRLILLVACLTVVLAVQTLPSTSSPHLGSPSTVGRLTQNPAQDNNTRVRFLFWGVALEMLRLHPLAGVGGNNYDALFGVGRAEFAATYPNSSLTGMNEDLLAVYAHNEYLQMLAELGLVGFFCVLLFAAQLLNAFRRALHNRKMIFPALGAAGAMFAFAISSGASASSFRYFGGGLMFFFTAGILVSLAAEKTPDTTHPLRVVHLSKRFCLNACSIALASVLVIFGMLTAQATGSILDGVAQSSGKPTKAEKYYRASLKVFPMSPATQFSYGMWLNSRQRPVEAANYLNYAVARGFNSSVCYAYLAAAQEAAGDPASSERTLAAAVKSYPSSIFLLVRHYAALTRVGRSEEAKNEFARALAINSHAARGWQQVIDNDIDIAYAAAQKDKNISLPGKLNPQAGLFEVLQENERRFPEMVNQGWRARMRSQQP
ncbi:MAG TPA: O-antigen ligase family protein [Pyrinomonadaceae bacterium]|nr:O-antigen ligase family protein [Pyrinomonadaceae bacterium]